MEFQNKAMEFYPTWLISVSFPGGISFSSIESCYLYVHRYSFHLLIPVVAPCSVVDQYKPQGGLSALYDETWFIVDPLPPPLYFYFFDPLGRPTVTAGSDNCFCTCRPYVRPHISISSKAKQSENNVR